MTKHLNLFFVVISALCVQGLSGCVHNSGKCESNEHVIAHWTFDQVADSKIKDMSGCHDGVLKGSSGNDFIQKGVYGNAGFFDLGRNYVQIPHATDLSLTDDFSIKCVFMPFSVNGFKSIIFKGNRSLSPQKINYFVDLRDGKLELKTKNKDGEWSVFSTDAVIKPNKWYEAIILWKNGKVSIYVNGKLEKVICLENEFKGIKLIENKDDVIIGCAQNHRGGFGYHFHGLIDEIVIYNKSIDVNPQMFMNAEKARTSFLQNKIPNDSKRLSLKIRNLNELFENYKSQIIKSEYDKEKARNAILKVNKRLEQIDSAYSIFLDDFNRKIDSLETEIAYCESFLRNAKPGASFIVSALPTYKRIVKEQAFLKKLGKLEKSIGISMARNEYEGFQAIVLGNPNKDLNGIKVDVGDFIHENGKYKIPPESVEWGWIKSIKTSKPDIPVEFVGKIPDAIMENAKPVNVAKRDFTPVYFRFHANKKTVPGNYKGCIEFTHNGCSEKINVTLKVYDFVLPDASSLKIAFSFFESFYKNWYGYKELTEKQQMYIYRYLLKYRISPNNIYSPKKCYPEISTMQALEADGANFCTINGGKNVKEVSQKVAALGPTIEKLKKIGLYKDAYFYSFDELGYQTEKYDKAKKLLTAIRKAYPDLKCMQTSFPNPEIAPLFNVWCPLIDHFASSDNLKILEKMREKANAETWWYTADSPRYPFPNFFLDYPVFDCRVIMSLSYMYKVKGILYWSINREWKTNNIKGEKWPQVAWKPYIFHISNGSRKYKNGMGNFLYPGPNGKIYPSLRLENLRDGIEDYDYYKLLERKLADLKKNDPSNALITEAEKLIEIPPNVATAVNNYSPNPAYLIEYRNKVAEMIVRLSGEK